MQIHEITALNENFLARMAKGARDNAFRRATGVDWDTYKLAQTAGQSAPAATPVTPTPAATTVTPAPRPGSREAGAKARAASAARKGKTAAVANPSAAPVVYRFDGRALDPQIPRDAGIIKTLQAAGVTSATSDTRTK
jgi:hypothetical protein